MKHKKVSFDVDRFSEDLLTKRVVKERKGMRDAAEEIGVSAATLSRLENKGVPDVYTYFSCCKWLGVDMTHYFKNKKK
jgi:DNA-binding phage protein